MRDRSQYGCPPAELTPIPSIPRQSFNSQLPIAECCSTLEIVDVLGRSVATLISGTLEAGSHQARWDAQTASGVYPPARLDGGPTAAA